jgi:hypothetical protein
MREDREIGGGFLTHQREPSLVESLQVKLKLWGIFQELAGEREVRVELPPDSTIGDLLELLIKRHRKRFQGKLSKLGSKEVRSYMKFLPGGHATGPKTKLSEGDVVAIFPPVGGGALEEEKTIHDPVHGSMRLSGLVLDLVDTPEVQRLRNIRQLGLANLVFPGANHSRFEHTLGVAYLLKRMNEELKLRGHELNLLLAAATLHDVGHAPYSHTLEYLMLEYVGKDHMELTGDILRGKLSICPPDEFKRLRELRVPSVVEVLERREVDPDEVALLLLGKHRKPYLRQLIYSDIDVDQMDYLLRDAHFTGVALGMIDIDRLMRTLVVHRERMAILSKGIEAVEGLLTARALMYTSVYFHHAVRVAELMLANAVDFALSKGGPITIDNFYLMTDAELMERLYSMDGYPKDIVMRLRYRQLFKSAYTERRRGLSRVEKRRILKRYGRWAPVRELQNEIADKAGVSRGYVILDVPIVDIIISEPRLEKVGIPVLTDGKLVKLSELSPLAVALRERQAPRYLLRVVTPAKHVARVRRVVPRVLG